MSNELKRAVLHFLSYVDTEGPDDCWEWVGSKAQNGYGLYSGKPHGVPKSMSAHRRSYELFIGEIPEDMYVLHQCDTRGCVNPAHLVEGTQARNMREALERRRVFTRLPNETVLAIYNDPRNNIAEIAREYDVTYSHAWNIRNRRKRMQVTKRRRLAKHMT
jgi:hypothetical protein